MKIGLLLIATLDTVILTIVACKAEEVGFVSFWLPTAPSPCPSPTRGEGTHSQSAGHLNGDW